MIHSQRAKEGYLLIDNGFGPGVTEEFVRSSGINTPVVGEGQKFEAPTFTCRHCERIVILNPLRNRPRNHCFGCDHYICDGCETERLINGCVTMESILDKLQNEAIKSLGKG